MKWGSARLWRALFVHFVHPHSRKKSINENWKEVATTCCYVEVVVVCRLLWGELDRSSSAAACCLACRPRITTILKGPTDFSLIIVFVFYVFSQYFQIDFSLQYHKLFSIFKMLSSVSKFDKIQFRIPWFLYMTCACILEVGGRDSFLEPRPLLLTPYTQYHHPPLLHSHLTQL